MDVTPPCDLCSRNAGEYRITRSCCALRLVRSTPRGKHRKATWAHLASSLTDEQWQALRRDAEAAGLLQSKPVK